MNAEDFIFDHVDEQYQDYWFKVIGNTKKELTEQYMEMSMVEVTEVVYSVKENIVGVKQLFPFNYQVIGSTDKGLRKIFLLIQLANFLNLLKMKIN